MATSVRNPPGGVLRFYGRGGRQVVRAEPQGDGWWWFDGDDGAAIAALGRRAGRLLDLDLEVVARLEPDRLRVGGAIAAVDVVARRVGPAGDPLVVVTLDEGLLVVRHSDRCDRRVAVLVALVLTPPGRYVTPTPSPTISSDPALVGDVHAAASLAQLGLRALLGG